MVLFGYITSLVLIIYHFEYNCAIDSYIYPIGG